MYSITTNQSDPYGVLISNYIKSEFPIFLQRTDSALLDLLTTAIVGTGQTRFGPTPSPESLVAIRQVIAHHLTQQTPIPFLVGWGSEKPDGSPLDVAELFGFKMLKCLSERIKNFYIPGIVVNVRVEDASAPHLFFDRQEQARLDASHYTQAMVKLAKVLSLDHIIRVIPESTLVSEAAFNKEADSILPAMHAHIMEPASQEALNNLKALGWSGAISQETRDYYLGRYARNYPQNTAEQNAYILARYFSGSLARRKLGTTGVSKSWGGQNLEISFWQPTPGIATDLFPRRLYYRTLPSGITNNHIPPWRAKGFFKIGDKVKASLTSFNSTEFEFNPYSVTLSNSVASQTLRADYVVQ